MRECTAEVTVARWLLIAAAVALVSPHLSPAPAAVAAQIGLPGCPTICGDVVVPYPFGFSRGCYLPGFDLTCDTSSSQPRLLLGNGTLQLMDISLDNSTVRALGPNIHLQTSGKLAYGYSGNGTWGGPGWGLGDGSPYSLSEWRNEFILWGCFFFGELWLAGSDRVVTTCGSVCDPHEPLPLLPDPDKINGNKCSGTGCCQEPVSIGRASYDVQLNSIRNWSPDNEVTARYIMFIAEEGWFDLNRISTKLSSNVESIPTPVVLSWEVHSNTLQGPNATRDGNATCPADLGTTMCHSSYSSCTRMNREDRDYHYTCKCWDGYQGNPYLPQGCQGITLHSAYVHLHNYI
nr:unnamed protein product [Digitaria exilis]